MVSVAIDSNTGVLEIEVRAFTPEDAQTIGQSIIDHSAELVEELSREARDDAFGAAEPISGISLVRSGISAG